MSTATIKPRIVVTLSEGLISAVQYDGIDMSQVELILVDEDSEGADRDQTIDYCGERVFFAVSSLTPLDPEERAEIDRVVAAI